jgi:ABC-type nitrate/sulfonate/bicarbonate transport system ATPase subunit
LYKNYGPLAVLQDINLQVGVGEFVTLIGPSGCGKSTIFNILAGLEEADAGEILLDGQPLNKAGQVAFMPQRDALLPWRTILDNVILGLELRKVPRKEARRRALGQLETFGLKGFEQNYPFQLSGGMRQRAALLRTILMEREVLLLDEPFGALDALTRATLQEWLLRLQSQLRRTILFITHDVDEAILLSDRIYVLTPRPASVSLVQEVTLPRPRPPEITTAPEFVALKAKLLAALKAEGAL